MVGVAFVIAVWCIALIHALDDALDIVFCKIMVSLEICDIYNMSAVTRFIRSGKSVRKVYKFEEVR